MENSTSDTTAKRPFLDAFLAIVTGIIATVAAAAIISFGGIDKVGQSKPVAAGIAAQEIRILDLPHDNCEFIIDTVEIQKIVSLNSVDLGDEDLKKAREIVVAMNKALKVNRGKDGQPNEWTRNWAREKFDEFLAKVEAKVRPR